MIIRYTNSEIKRHKVRGGCLFADNFTHLLFARFPLEFPLISQIPDCPDSQRVFLHDSCRHLFVSESTVGRGGCILSMVLRDTSDYFIINKV